MGSESLEGVPVPVGAELVDESDDFGPHSGAMRRYRFPGVDPGAVVDFYRERLPIGEGYGPWDWCNHAERSESEEWVFTQGDEVLGVYVFPTDEPPGLLVVSDSSGPC